MHRAILVTGASSGIGETIAVRLAREGFAVYAAARSAEKMTPLQGLAGGRITPVALDVTDDASVEEAAATIRRRQEEAGRGPLFGLVNNAGVAMMGPVETTSIEEWRAQFETNLFGQIRVTQAFAPQMRASRAGRIVNIGSVAGRIAVAFQGLYASSKHALEGANDALRRELAPFGVCVSLVRPGFINTSLGAKEQESLSRQTTPDSPYKERLERFAAWHHEQHPSAPGPDVVADCVAHAMTATRPKTHYAAPARAARLLALRRTLPEAAIDRVIARIIGKDP